MSNYPLREDPGTGFILSLIAGVFVASQSVLLLPFWMGVTIDFFSFSEAQGGWVATLQLGAGSLATLAIAPFVHRVEKHKVFAFGFLLSILGNGVSITSIGLESTTLLFAGRLLSGVGEGSLMAIIGAAAAGTPKPIKTFAIMNSAVALVAAGIYFASPYLLTIMGASGVFAIMLVATCIGLPFVRYFAQGTSQTVQMAAVQPDSQTGGFSVSSLLALFIFGLLACVIGGTFAFSQRIGVNNIGLDMESIGMTLGVASILTVIGPLLASRLGNRMGIRVPVFLAIGAYGVVALSFSTAQVAWLFVAAVIGHAITAGFATTFLAGFLASWDSSGRVVAAAPAFGGFGNALGPSMMAAALPLMPGYQAIGLVAVMVLSLVGVSFFVLTHLIDHSLFQMETQS